MWRGIYRIFSIYSLPGDNTEKIWAPRFFAKQKTDMPKARKMAAGNSGSAVGFPVGVRGQALKG